jgi:hypothetical protein
MPVPAAFLLGLLAAAGPASAAEAEEGPLSIGFKYDNGRESNTTYSELGPTLLLTLITSREDAANRFKLETGLAYGDAWTKFDGENGEDNTRVRTVDLKYARISVLQLGGFDLKDKTGVVPFFSGGVQYVDSRGDFDGERFVDFYWAPTFGGGIDIALKKKLTLSLAYDQNTEKGDRLVRRLSVELRFDVFGRSGG